MEKLQIELISFGNELLIGEIVDTNSQWLALTLSKAGAVVSRMMTISDDLEDITSAFQECLRRKPDIIISTGGLGPTWDDQTLVGLGKALVKDVIRDETAFRLIREKYDKFKIELSSAGEKMANIPEGATPLFNKIGTAPGVLYQTTTTAIFCLPGIPKEMKIIFEDHISPFVQERTEGVNFFEKKFLITGSYESKIAKITKKFTEIYPTIYIKSHPRENKITVHLTTYGSQNDFELLNKVHKDLKKELTHLGNIQTV